MTQCPIGQREALGLWPCSRAEGGKRYRGQSGEQRDQVLRQGQNGTMALACLLQGREQKTSHPGSTRNSHDVVTVGSLHSEKLAGLHGTENQEATQAGFGILPFIHLL